VTKSSLFASVAGRLLRLTVTMSEPEEFIVAKVL
jgi:hypothetical protein